MTISSCTPGEPLTKLEEDGQAAILNYNLPQSTTYEVTSFLQLDIDESLFHSRERAVPPDNYWQRLDDARKQNDSILEHIQRVLVGRAYSPISEIMNVGLNLTAQQRQTASGVKFKAGNISVSTASSEFSTEYIAHKIDEGFRPVLYARPSGTQGLRFAPRPGKPTPSIFLVLHLRMASFLGDYGAGQTLSTFSLLPGEKTVIEIRDYRHNTTTSTTSESILDSYSESSMDDLQTTLEERTTQNESSTTSDTDTMSADLGVSGGVNLGIVKLGADVSGSASSVNTATEAVSNQVDSLNSAVDHHVQTADTQRQIEINTDVTSTSISETETTTTRTLENMNRSRVLNFVFRQLLQEYFTLTYLENVSLVYSNGYDLNRRTGTLESTDNLLRAVLSSPKAVEKVRNDIFVQLCNIPDHTGQKVSFIERAVDKAVNCIDPSATPAAVLYVRKRRIQQTYRDKTVDGVILDATHRVLRTPSVIVDALLGQGEALDCYNQQLQEAAFTGAQLTNQAAELANAGVRLDHAKAQQAMAVLDGIADPVQKAELYQLIFGPGPVDPDATTES